MTFMISYDKKQAFWLCFILSLIYSHHLNNKGQCVSPRASPVYVPITPLLSLSPHQGQKVATCLFTTCPRNLETLSSCKCSYLLATSSQPKSLWTEQPIRANVLVSQQKKKRWYLALLSFLFFSAITFMPLVQLWVLIEVQFTFSKWCCMPLHKGSTKGN